MYGKDAFHIHLYLRLVLVTITKLSYADTMKELGLVSCDISEVGGSFYPMEGEIIFEGQVTTELTGVTACIR